MSEYDDLVGDFYDDWNEWLAWKAYAYTSFGSMKIAAEAANYGLAFAHLYAGLSYLDSAFDFINPYYQFPFPRYKITRMFEIIGDSLGEPPPEYELTITKLIQSFIHPDTIDAERSIWMSLTDAYRASMYDKPFDPQYHAAWVRRFKSWA